jgi:hypothetical protein
MQKVSKELLDRVRTKKHVIPKVAPPSLEATSVTGNSYIYSLMVAREALLIKALGTSLATSEKNGGLFEVWMKSESDNIQALATYASTDCVLF